MINHFRSVAFVFSIIFLLGANARPVLSQFHGSFDLSGFHSTNVEGRDTSSPDRLFQPQLDLGFDLSLSAYSTLQLAGTLGKCFYTVTPERSYLYTSLNTLADFYLSHHEKIAEEAGQTSRKIIRDPTEITQRSNAAPSHLNGLDVRSIIVQLSDLGEYIDSLPILNASPKKNGLETSFKDSASATLLALAEILYEQNFTESVKAVTIEELSNLREVITKIEVLESERIKAVSTLNTLVSQFTNATTQSDLFPVPIQTGSEKGDVAAVQSEDTETEPLVMLISTNQFMYSQYSYTNIGLGEDADVLTGKTFATHLSIPASLQYQKNQNIYATYTNTEINIMPHLEFSLSKKIKLGVGYRFAFTHFPNDTLFTNIDNRVVTDIRAELTQHLAFFGSIGVGLRQYPRPLRFEETIRKRNVMLKYTSPPSYTQFSFTSGIAFFPSKSISLALFGKMTTSPTLDSPTYSITDQRRGTYNGIASIDEYTYTTKGIYLYLTSRLPGEIDIGVDIQRENNEYLNHILVEKRPSITSTITRTRLDRTENVTLIALDISRPFYFRERFASIFSYIIPSVAFTNTNLRSTFEGYSYHDFTSRIQLSLGF